MTRISLLFMISGYLSKCKNIPAVHCLCFVIYIFMHNTQRFKQPLPHFSSCSFQNTLFEWHFLRSPNRGDPQLSSAVIHKSHTQRSTASIKYHTRYHSLSLYHIWYYRTETLYHPIKFGM